MADIDIQDVEAIRVVIERAQADARKLRAWKLEAEADEAERALDRIVAAARGEK